MKTTIKTLVAAAAIACMSTVAHAQESTTLQDLLKKVEQSATTQSRENQQREAVFKRERDQQARLLREAKAALAAEEARGTRLANQFAANEQALIDKEVELETAQGDLGEMFGVVRQASADAYGRISTSIVSAQYPGRDVFLAEMSNDAKGLPNIAELRKLWISLQTEMTASGQVEKFDAEVLNLEGGKSTQSVLRIGTFNLIGEQGYLVYDDAENTIEPLGRQPDGFQVSTTQDILNATSGLIPVFVDPSRGTILNLFKQKATWKERYMAGKEVGFVITGMLAIGLIIGLYKFITLNATGAKMKSQLKNIDTPNEKNPLGRILTVYQSNKQADVETLELKLDEAILRELPSIDRGVNIIKIFAAIAPLLGLLGTVLGMIETFQQITLFGTGDPRIMAGSISMALVTTAQGIIAALPLILVHSVVASKAKSIVHVLDEQTAGFIAAKAETEKA